MLFLVVLFAVGAIPSNDIWLPDLSTTILAVGAALVLDNKNNTKSVVGNILAAVLTLLRCESISSDSFLYSRILRTCGPHADVTAQKVLVLACQLFDEVVVKHLSFDLRFEFFVSVLLDDLLFFSHFLSHDIKNQRGQLGSADARKPRPDCRQQESHQARHPETLSRWAD